MALPQILLPASITLPSSPAIQPEKKPTIRLASTSSTPSTVAVAVKPSTVLAATTTSTPVQVTIPSTAVKATIFSMVAQEMTDSQAVPVTTPISLTTAAMWSSKVLEKAKMPSNLL